VAERFPASYPAEASVIVEGLDGSPLTSLSLILRSPRQQADRIDIPNPTPSWAKCRCGKGPYRFYAYRLLTPDGPLIPG
jgi:hypothetical protein